MKFLLIMLRGLLFAVLPFFVYFALQRYQPREVATVLLMLLLLRTPGKSVRFLRGLGWRASLMVVGVLVLMLLVWTSNDPVWVLSYPVFMNGLMLSLFVASLLHPPSVIERLARLRHPDLPPDGVAYARQVTLVWSGFFAINGGVAAWTVFAASRETWVLYNGLISYLLMGALFAGEWLFRRWHFGTEATR